MSKTFKGYYFKHQKDGKTVAFIVGKTNSNSFIQIITDKFSSDFNFPASDIGEKIIIGRSVFSAGGIHIDLPEIYGDIKYSGITPIKSDIMGPFKFFPMECRHMVVSMRHTLNGMLTIRNEIYNFDNGIGYIEGDSGRSFPEKYLWIQANDFSDKSSFMLSIAKIPFCGMHFQGCICIIINKGKEYRLATYLGSKVKFKDNTIIITQNQYVLIIDILSHGAGFSLLSPERGKMSGIIKEHNNTKIRIRLIKNDRTVCDIKSDNAGFECSGYPLKF